MSNTRIQFLPESEAITRIVETVRKAGKGEAPFALVLGAGFSHGLVPTTSELVTESLPLWMRSLTDKVPFEELKGLPLDQRAKTAREFWSRFTSRNSRLGLNLPLDPTNGLPSNHADAYKAAFSPLFGGAVGAPAEARIFQRKLMQLDRPRLNAAHFLLASLLGVQPGRNRPGPLFKTEAAFSRLILTTNFDPFLQIALQAVNRLYLLSDTPELGLGDEVSDDQIDAIHLVYLHGSIHRRSQAATEHDIAMLKEKNARTLQPVLKQRGVIVLGYSGWDDAIVEALAACNGHDHLLYWIGLEADPLSKGAFGPRVADILHNGHKETAFYVRTAGAGWFMAQLCERLVVGLPRLLANPIAQLREMLETIDLSELRHLAKATASSVNSPEPFALSNCNEVFAEAHSATLNRLQKAERVFLGQVTTTAASTSDLSSIGASAETAIETGRITAVGATQERVEQLLSSVRMAQILNNHSEVLRLGDEALRINDLMVGDRASVLQVRAHARYQLGDKVGALHDLTRIIDLVGAPAEEVSRALINRGVLWREKEDMAKAVADYARVIEQMPGAPVDQLAWALVNRGVIFGLTGETEKELADYTRVIELLPGAPADQVARALINRGFAFRQKGETQKAIVDFTRVIEGLPDAPEEQVAWALIQRGVAHGQAMETEEAISDYTRVIERMPGVSIEPVTWALFNRGFVLGQKGETEKAMADYTRVIEQMPGAPVEQVATSLVNRGVAWSQNGETEKAVADYTRVIEQLPEAPVEQVARALCNRAWGHYDQGRFDQFLADSQNALRLDGTQDVAAFNLGLAFLACGRDKEAMDAYSKAARQFPDRIETLGLPDLEDARKSWLSDERAKPVLELLRGLMPAGQGKES